MPAPSCPLPLATNRVGGGSGSQAPRALCLEKEGDKEEPICRSRLKPSGLEFPKAVCRQQRAHGSPVFPPTAIPACHPAAGVPPDVLSALDAVMIRA